MNTSGGFLLEPSHGAKAGPSKESLGARHEEEEEGSVNARKLTAKQELRLMNYLDEEFLQVNRGFSKRHNKRTSTVPTLDSFLQAYSAILEVVASIPPIGPSVPLLVSYLLRLTSELLDGIAGYQLSAEATHDNDGEEDTEEVIKDVPLLTEQLQYVIQCLSILDKVWSSVLKGQLIDINAARINVERDFKDSDDYFPQGQEDERQYKSAKAGINDVAGRYPSQSHKGQHLKEAKSIVGSKGFASVAQTDRIRLRNVIMLGKENLFAWMRIQLNVPLPPPQIGAEEDVGEEEDLEEVVNPTMVKAENLSAIEGENDLEEVDTDRLRPENGKEESIKREGGGDPHYDDLFARKIDPDASDSESEIDEHIEDEHSPSSPPSKRMKRPQRSESREHSSAPPNDVESIATFSNTATVMKWDIKFARLFASTLRSLSDIQEYRNQRDANQRSAEGKE